MSLSTQQSELMKSLASQGPIPQHVAIIMDGNGRWAQARGLPRLAGHKRGADRVREIVEASALAGVKALSLYAFSDENWGRPEAEVSGLMNLLDVYLKNEKRRLKEEGIRLQTMGDIGRLPPHAQQSLREAEEELAAGSKMILNIALSYGSRNEITRACRLLAQAVREGKLQPEEITIDHVSKSLWTTQLPDPDLLIRTSGEQRLSNFMLWQCAYTEFYFTNTLWPEFTAEGLHSAMKEFQGRHRRYGLATSSSASN